MLILILTPKLILKLYFHHLIKGLTIYVIILLLLLILPSLTMTINLLLQSYLHVIEHLHAVFEIFPDFSESTAYGVVQHIIVTLVILLFLDIKVFLLFFPLRLILVRIVDIEVALALQQVQVVVLERHEQLLVVHILDCQGLLAVEVPCLDSHLVGSEVGDQVVLV